jgi:hypothetical protein
MLSSIKIAFRKELPFHEYVLLVKTQRYMIYFPYGRKVLRMDKTFIENMKNARIKAGLTQNQLAEKIG